MQIDKIDKQTTKLFKLSKNHTAYVTVKKTNLIFLIHERQKEKEQYIINGKSDKWYKKVSDFEYRDYCGYCYNVETETHKSFVVNGKKSNIERAKLWGINKKREPFYTQSVNLNKEYPHATYFRSEQLKYPFYNTLILSQDLENFSYQSATYPDYDDFRFIINDRIFFDGAIYDIYILKDVSSSSWMGCHNNEDRHYPYMKGKNRVIIVNIMNR